MKQRPADLLVLIIQGATVLGVFLAFVWLATNYR